MDNKENIKSKYFKEQTSCQKILMTLMNTK